MMLNKFLLFEYVFLFGFGVFDDVFRIYVVVFMILVCGLMNGLYI